ncbi:MAG TPA: NDP-sugar synthase [Myxococcota bacterium]|nr:NDP-sugar synthase [Myxococcota bacterium]
MIVAAGRGTRLAPLTDWLPKPAVPVRGVPLIAYQLALLAHHGVTEVVINTHHLPERLEDAARRHCPPGVALTFSHERELLDTGGGIRRVAAFLRESDPCLLVGGDMLLDVDLGALLRVHRERTAAVTLLLREDPREVQFGSIGVDRTGVVCRIGSRFRFRGDPNDEVRAGLYAWANAVSARAFESMPDREVFSHLNDWLAPHLAEGARDVHGAFVPCTWEPVGTLPEYLDANRRPPALSYLDADAVARAAGVRFEGDNVIGAGASLGAGARLTGVVVWDGERVPDGCRARDGVFAGGRFHSLDPSSGGSEP